MNGVKPWPGGGMLFPGGKKGVSFCFGLHTSRFWFLLLFCCRGPILFLLQPMRDVGLASVLPMRAYGVGGRVSTATMRKCNLLLDSSMRCVRSWPEIEGWDAHLLTFSFVGRESGALSRGRE
ncbi:unnamed protein product [Ectocarpus sp. 12 AP-2014]